MAEVIDSSYRGIFDITRQRVDPSSFNISSRIEEDSDNWNLIRIIFESEEENNELTKEQIERLDQVYEDIQSGKYKKYERII